eukprot:m.20096 g.20096  ORF g.20096 m.20096 type:complete len:58 (-) comp8543_c0_seq1:3474-3647(-)
MKVPLYDCWGTDEREPLCTNSEECKFKKGSRTDVHAMRGTNIISKNTFLGRFAHPEL